MSSKINLSEIFIDHFKSMRNERTGRISIGDILVFFVIPVIFGLFIFYVHPSFSDEAVTIIVASLSIFAALLINVLLLIYNISDGSLESTPANSSKERLTKLFISEIFSNISYAIVISILSIIILSVIVFLESTLKNIATSIVSFLIANFILTLAMALKRIHVLLRLKFNSSQSK